MVDLNIHGYKRMIEEDIKALENSNITIVRERAYYICFGMVNKNFIYRAVETNFRDEK